MYCTNCRYKWENRVERPKLCPNCKIRLERNITVSITDLPDNLGLEVRRYVTQNILEAKR